MAKPPYSPDFRQALPLPDAPFAQLSPGPLKWTPALRHCRPLRGTADLSMPSTPPAPCPPPKPSALFPSPYKALTLTCFQRIHRRLLEGVDGEGVGAGRWPLVCWGGRQRPLLPWRPCDLVRTGLAIALNQVGAYGQSCHSVQGGAGGSASGDCVYGGRRAGHARMMPKLCCGCVRLQAV